MIFLLKRAFIVTVLLFFSGSLRLLAIEERTRTALEALGRLKGVKLESNPALKQAVLRVLEQVRGEPEFVTLVRDFNLSGQELGLTQFIVTQPQTPAAVEALRHLLASPATNALTCILSTSGEKLPAIINALGKTEDNRIVGLLQPLVVDSKQPLPVRRAAVSALAKVNDGAAALLALAKTERLSDDLKFLAGSELRGTRWPSVRSEAEKLFPALAAKSNQALPPVAELIKLPGEAAHGAAVFRRADVGCINCHQVNGEGVDFGPKLSEIGSKLGKDALCESILDPSAGISFGYEGWSLTFKNGDEAFGLMASETEEELVLKAQGGTVTRYKKSDLAKREKQALSVMPAGLQQNLTTQDFADLLEYLSSLRKATN